ncbi:MAG: hypothetical protein GX663_11215 [Clostridiales bacterium]|nr:hypothetical protein [Clostridiales bacterium]
MESVGYMGFIFGMVAFFWCISLTTQVRELKRMIQDAGIGYTEKASLREILEKSIGKSADLKLEGSGMNTNTTVTDCLIQEVDEEWALVIAGKKKEEKLVRIRTIRSINLK